MKEDNIDKRIERVVESVGSKKATMRQWESDRIASEMRRKVAAKRRRTYGISAAASVVVICGVGLGIFLNRGGNNDYGVTSSAPVYRGGSCDISEIQAMIDSTHYEEAQRAIEATLADTIIDPTYSDERKEYLRNVNKNQEYELTWLKIQVLVKLNKKQDAYNLLKEYTLRDGLHKAEAQGLLEKMKE